MKKIVLIIAIAASISACKKLSLKPCYTCYFVQQTTPRDTCGLFLGSGTPGGPPGGVQNIAFYDAQGNRLTVANCIKK